MFSRSAILRLFFGAVICHSLTGIHGSRQAEGPELTGKPGYHEESSENDVADPRLQLYEMFINGHDDEVADVELDDKNELFTANKRDPYSFGLGKRGVYEFGLGKRYLPVMQLGKKEDPIYAFGLGKRNPYAFGLGKRDPYAFGLGKRNPYAFGLGKRDSMGLGKKRDPYAFGLGKRDPYSFGLGK